MEMGFMVGIASYMRYCMLVCFDETDDR